jgi:hypothetical protein
MGQALASASLQNPMDRLSHGSNRIFKWKFKILGNFSGAQSRDRTSDTAIFNRMLYQLSYLGVFEPGEPPRHAALIGGR